MTGQELMDCAIKECRHLPPWLAQAIDDAIAVGRGKERERCAQVVWECRGHCVTDDAARDLMEQVRRAP